VSNSFLGVSIKITHVAKKRVYQGCHDTSVVLLILPKDKKRLISFCSLGIPFWLRISPQSITNSEFFRHKMVKIENASTNSQKTAILYPYGTNNKFATFCNKMSFKSQFDI
jgi:hypothetical protein